MTGHDHGTATAGQGKRLGAVLIVTLIILVAEVIGAIAGSSLVLAADAGHLAADTGGIVLSLLAVWFARKGATTQRTFGYQRLEILAATVNAVVLFAIGAWILYAAVNRLIHPQAVNSAIMAIFGAVALAGNAISLSLLRAGQRESLNVRGAFLEVFSDFLGAVATLVAAAVVAITGWDRADAAASFVVGLFILPRTWSLLRSAVDVLLEATPRDVDLDAVRRHIEEVEGVQGCHDLHVWTITSGMNVLSVHVVIDGRDHELILDELGDCLAGHFDIEHSTFQLESVDHQEHEHKVCI
jgi:cobalt-zinc-cadmium efflux system protein